ncbi:MAG: response regulator transcription factor [Planctomycetes bacterium]|nr:response regulator transcription factor [Planctomycetota bacterium]
METPVVHIVGDDATERQSLRDWVFSLHFTPKEYERADLMLRRLDLDLPGCVLLGMHSSSVLDRDDLRMLRNVPPWVPTIVLTTHADVSLAVRAMRAGAIDVLQRPLDQQGVRDAVFAAIEVDARRRNASHWRDGLMTRFLTLTVREQEVLRLVVEGNANKAMASHLHLSPKTIEVHRAHVMKKMQADSVATLVRMYMKVLGTGAFTDSPP